MLSIPLCYSIVMESMTIYKIRLNFKEASSGFLILLGTIQIVLISFCLANDNGEIIKMVNEIEQTVNQSKVFYFFKLIFDWKLKHSRIGSRHYHQTYEIYQAIERRNDVLSNEAWKLRVVFLFGAYGPSVMYPIFLCIIQIHFNCST